MVRKCYGIALCHAWQGGSCPAPGSGVRCLFLLSGVKKSKSGRRNADVDGTRRGRKLDSAPRTPSSAASRSAYMPVCCVTKTTASPVLLKFSTLSIFIWSRFKSLAHMILLVQARYTAQSGNALPTADSMASIVRRLVSLTLVPKLTTRIAVVRF